MSARERLVDAGFAAGWAAVRALPEPVAAAGFAAGGTLAARRDSKGVRRLRANLARVAPGEDLVGRAMRSYARYWRETFRLSRIGADVKAIGPAGAVTPPDRVNLREIVHKVIGETPTGTQARVWVADGRATALRRLALVVGPRELDGRAGEEISIDIGMSDRLAREIASYGADAVVLEPQALRDEVLERLRAQAEVGV